MLHGVHGPSFWNTQTLVLCPQLALVATVGPEHRVVGQAILALKRSLCRRSSCFPTRKRPYQANDDFMMHDEPVLALTFSRDSELLASGSRDGHIKVWRVTTGQCVRRFTKAHSEGVTCLAFSSDCTQVVSGSFEAVGRVHGLKSGKSLKELRGHSSYINAIAYAPDGKQSKQSSSAHTALTPLTTHTTPSLHSLQATASSPAPPTARSRYGT